MPEMSDNTRSKSLMIVDDELTLLKILQRMFKRHYSVYAYDNPQEALKALQSGVKPGVILSDQKMPGMTGSELLKKSIQYVPQASRIILTGYSNPKDIIACINEGQALMYMTKPAEEMELIQNIKIAFEIHNTKLSNAVQINDLKKKIRELESGSGKVETPKDKEAAVSAPSASSPTPIIQSLAGINNQYDKYYFPSFPNHVTIIAKALANEMDMKPDQVALIVLSTFLLHTLIAGMPKKLQLMDPVEMLDPNMLKDYFTYFNRSIAELNRIDALKPYTALLSQIWEHNDGSGYPRKLSGKNIRTEAFIVAISVIYVNSVYRMQFDKYPILMKKGKIVQTPAVTKERHDELIKNMFRRASWFELDTFQMFQDMVKKGRIPELIPLKENLTLNFFEYDNILASYIHDNLSDIGYEGPVGTDEIAVDLNAKPKGPIEKELPIDQLTVGMKVIQTVSTKNGIVVCRPETTISSVLLSKILQMKENGSLTLDEILVEIEATED